MRVERVCGVLVRGLTRAHVRYTVQTNADDVRRKFERHGDVVDVRLVRDPATKQSRYAAVARAGRCVPRMAEAPAHHLLSLLRQRLCLRDCQGP